MIMTAIQMFVDTEIFVQEVPLNYGQKSQNLHSPLVFIPVGSDNEL